MPDHIIDKYNKYVNDYGKNLGLAASGALEFIYGQKNNNKDLLCFSDFLKSIEFKKIFISQDEWDDLPQDDKVLNSKIINPINTERIDKYKTILKKIWPFPVPDPEYKESDPELFFCDYYSRENKLLIDFKTLDVMSYNSHHINYHVLKIKEELENIKKLPSSSLSEQEINRAKNYFIDIFALGIMKDEVEKKFDKIHRPKIVNNWNSDQEAFEFISSNAKYVNENLSFIIDFDYYFKDKYISGRKSYEKSSYLDLNVDEINYLAEYIQGRSDNIFYATQFFEIDKKLNDYIKSTKISHALKRFAKQKTKDFVNKFKDFDPDKYNRSECFDENKSKYGSDFIDIDRILKIKEIMSLNNKDAIEKMYELYKLGTLKFQRDIMNPYFLEQENYKYEAEKYFFMSFEKVETKFKALLSDEEYKKKLTWFFKLKTETRKSFEDIKTQAIKKILIDDVFDIYGFKLEDYRDRNDYKYVWIFGKDDFDYVCNMAKIKKIIFDEKLNPNEKKEKLYTLGVDIKKSFGGYLHLYKKYFDVSKLTPENKKKVNDFFKDIKERLKLVTKKEILVSRIFDIMKIIFSLFTILLFDKKIFSKVIYAKEKIELEKCQDVFRKIEKLFKNQKEKRNDVENMRL